MDSCQVGLERLRGKVIETELACISAGVVGGDVLSQLGGCVEDATTLSTYDMWMPCLHMFGQLAKLLELLVALFASPRVRAMYVADVLLHVAFVREIRAAVVNRTLHSAIDRVCFRVLTQ
jgi:hypothetical protein